MDAALDSFGRIDVVVNNAGIGTPGLLHELSVEEIQHEIATDLLGTMLVARRAIPSMLERRCGDLVFISSMAVAEPRPFQAGYTAAKAGVEGFARVLAKELEGSGIRCTVVRLGPTRSEFGLGWSSDMLMRVLDSWKQWGFMRHTEMLEPEDVAATIVSAVTRPGGFSTDVIQLNPDGSTRRTRPASTRSPGAWTRCGPPIRAGPSRDHRNRRHRRARAGRSPRPRRTSCRSSPGGSAPQRRAAGPAVMLRLGLLAASLAGRWRRARTLDLRFSHRGHHVPGLRYVGSRREQELEQDGAFELFHRGRDLVPGALRRRPLRDDPLGVGDSHLQRGRPDAPFPNDFLSFYDDHLVRLRTHLRGAPEAPPCET